jgi:probable addiction module antidote protein
MNQLSIYGRTGGFHEHLIESLRDPETASAYLKVAIEEYQEDNNAEVFLLALRNVAEAKGGISFLAEQTHLNRQHLYRTLSGQGNPRLSTLGTVLKGLGFHLSIEANQC